MAPSYGYLTDIIERKRAELRASPPRPGPSPTAAARPFAATLRRPSELTVVAEVKRRSPVKGDIDPGLDPIDLVRRYEEGGAAACSVLTDSGFAGTLTDLEEARAACDLPLLRKDFLLDPAQCVEGRAAGADAVLLIATALGGALLDEMMAAAADAGVEALVEVHDEAELERALAAGAKLVGVNNRDLQTFEVHIDTSLRLAGLFPPDAVRVSESGIINGGDAGKVRDAGYDAVLVGEALVRAADPGALIAELSRCS
jgi:indole-3-glycerol phosphate synthase